MKTFFFVLTLVFLGFLQLQASTHSCVANDSIVQQLKIIPALPNLDSIEAGKASALMHRKIRALDAHLRQLHKADTIFLPDELLEQLEENKEMLITQIDSLVNYSGFKREYDWKFLQYSFYYLTPRTQDFLKEGYGKSKDLHLEHFFAKGEIEPGGMSMYFFRTFYNSPLANKSLQDTLVACIKPVVDKQFVRNVWMRWACSQGESGRNDLEDRYRELETFLTSLYQGTIPDSLKRELGELAYQTLTKRLITVCTTDELLFLVRVCTKYLKNNTKLQIAVDSCLARSGKFHYGYIEVPAGSEWDHSLQFYHYMGLLRVALAQEGLPSYFGQKTRKMKVKGLADFQTFLDTIPSKSLQFLAQENKSEYVVRFVRELPEVGKIYLAKVQYHYVKKSDSETTELFRTHLDILNQSALQMFIKHRIRGWMLEGTTDSVITLHVKAIAELYRGTRTDTFQVFNEIRFKANIQDLYSEDGEGWYLIYFLDAMSDLFHFSGEYPILMKEIAKQMFIANSTGRRHSDYEFCDMRKSFIMSMMKIAWGDEYNSKVHPQLMPEFIFGYTQEIIGEINKKI